MQRPMVRIILLLLLATALAIAATRILTMSSDEKGVDEGSDLDRLETELVAVAKDNLEMGTPLKVEDLRVASWPKHLLPEGTVKKPKEIAGRILRVPVASGIPVLEGALLAPGASTEIDWRIESGHRAMSIRTTSSGGLAGFVFPGSRVDVLVTFDAPGSVNTAGLIATTLAQDLRVLATDQEMNHDPEATREIVGLVTLEVSPEEAERLLLGLSEGELHLVMRFGDEEERSDAAGVTAADLVPDRYYKQRAEKSPPRENRRPSVSVIRGLNTTAERI